MSRIHPPLAHRRTISTVRSPRRLNSGTFEILESPRLTVRIENRGDMLLHDGHWTVMLTATLATHAELT